MTMLAGPTAAAPMPDATAAHLRGLDEHCAHNYAPLPVVLTGGSGAEVTDVDGRRYLDFLAGYSALNFGHGHPALLAAAHRQLDRLTLTSRAFGNDQLGPFCAELAGLIGKQRVLPMNTGAEAVESALKVARKWGYQVKGVPAERAEIVVAAGGFHGRTISVVSFSTDPTARDGFGPFTPGFRIVPYGDLPALRAAVGPHTVAVLLEPVQGEAGVVVPPAGYLAGVRRVCDGAGVLWICDEIQSGLGRTGHLLATRAAGVDADVYLLGKALGGGIVPISAVVADAAVLDVLAPGQHGSTFGGNPLACAVGRAVIGLLAADGPGGVLAGARELGEVLHAELEILVGRGVSAVRGVGPWAGVDVDPRLATGREVSEAMARHGVLVTGTHGSTVRLSPPLVATPEQIRAGIEALRRALGDLGAGGVHER